MSEYDFKQAYKDNEKRLIRLYEEELLITENDFGCIEANENVMRLNYEMLQKELASLHAIIKRQQEELAIAAELLEAEKAAHNYDNVQAGLGFETHEQRHKETEAALEELRNFVRYTFPLQDPSDIRYANRDAEILISKWEATEESADS